MVFVKVTKNNGSDCAEISNKKTIAMAMALVSDKNEWVYSSEVSACKKAIKPPASK